MTEQNDRTESGKESTPKTTDERLDLLDFDGDESDDLLEFAEPSNQKATIKVIGVGGGGGNAINSMIEAGMTGVEFIAANTDAQALQHNRASTRVQLGAEVTRGLGCGANPDRGRASALEARDRLRELLEGTDMVFVTAGMGGGTGTGAAPIIAEVAREVGALTVGVVTKPFPFEGRVRTKHADRGISELHDVVDTLITIPNQRLLALAGKTTGIKDAFSLADEVLLNATRGISDLITIHGLINLDFADVRTVMNAAGVALMGTGVGVGEGRAMEAARAAISSPLLEDLSIDGARGVLINITGDSDMTLFEVNEASMLVQEAAHEEAEIIFGAVVDDTLPEGELRVTVIATGLADSNAPKLREPREAETSVQNVRPLRPQDAESLDAPPATASQQPKESVVQVGDPLVDVSLSDEPPAGWDSPFEDELDVPAFLRKRGDTPSGGGSSNGAPVSSGGSTSGTPAAEEKKRDDPQDRDVPAFFRKAQD